MPNIENIKKEIPEKYLPSPESPFIYCKLKVKIQNPTNDIMQSIVAVILSKSNPMKNEFEPNLIHSHECSNDISPKLHKRSIEFISNKNDTREAINGEYFVRLSPDNIINKEPINGKNKINNKF